MPLSAAATAALSSGAQTAGTGLFGWIGAKRQRKFAQEQSNRAYQHEIDMYEKANAYNAPDAQMNRLKSAGLNPNLVYGQSSGAASGTAAQTMPKYQRAETPVSVPKFNVMEVMGQYQAIKAQKLSNDAQAINNRYLATKLMLQQGMMDNVFRKGKLDLGDTGYRTANWQKGKGFPITPYEQRYQQQIKGFEISNALQSEELDFIKGFGSKQGTKSLIQLLQLLK